MQVQESKEKQLIDEILLEVTKGSEGSLGLLKQTVLSLFECNQLDSINAKQIATIRVFCKNKMDILFEGILSAFETKIAINNLKALRGQNTGSYNDEFIEDMEKTRVISFD